MKCFVHYVPVAFVQANSESFVLYILGKATARWTRSRGDQTQLVPAFNGFQVTEKSAAVSAAPAASNILSRSYLKG
jgi:hypothetical protein